MHYSTLRCAKIAHHFLVCRVFITPVIITLLPCKSVALNLQCYTILFTIYYIIAASSIVNFGWLYYCAITEYCYALSY